MTDGKSPGQEGYWSELAERAEAGDVVDESDDQERGDDVGTEMVLEQIVDALGSVKQLHAIAATHRSGSAVYLVVTSTRQMVDVSTAPDLEIPVVDARTVVVDLEDEVVTVTKNGLWVPRDESVVRQITSGMARAQTDASGNGGDAPPIRRSSDEVGLDVELLLGREWETDDGSDGGQHVDRMRRDPGVSPARSWGYGGGPPPEAADLVERLEAAGLDPSDHLTRLKWGTKEPIDREPRPFDELVGNFGVETRARDEGLVVLDVDYPEELPNDVDLPETFTVTSPHGSEDRQHRYYRCDDKDRFASEVGAWAVQGATWGDLWVGERYVVGPGSQLSAYGCDNGTYERGDRGACSWCEHTERGYYRVLEDRPIAEIDADDLLDLLDLSEGWETRERVPESPDDDVDDGDDPTEDDLEDGLVRCDNCGSVCDVDDAKTLDLGDSERHICAGGCE
jgi:hypothetical protein